MQLYLVLAAVVLGLGYNYFAGGLPFNGIICLLAGLFIVMPTLFAFNASDFKEVMSHKKLAVKSLAGNFIMLPLIATLIGYVFQDYGIAGGLFLLSVLSGGGLVMHWIIQSKANSKLGFILLFSNLALLMLSFLMFDRFTIAMADILSLQYQPVITQSDARLEMAIMPLVVVPFLLSRLLLWLLPSFVEVIKKYKKQSTNTAIFLLIAYLFSLENSHVIFTIDILTILKAFAATALFYLAAYFLARFLYDFQKAEDRVGFWFVMTRFITLALIVTSFTMENYGVTLLLPVIIAYFIQIPLAAYFNRKMQKL